MTANEIGQHRQLAERLARGAGRILKGGLTKTKQVSFKGRIDPVTEFDHKAERYIINGIRRAQPEHAVLAEESGAHQRDSEYRWVVDPLDGTVNFAHSFPMYCVSIALEYRGDIVAGAVFDPERNELFSAGLGRGATLNGSRIRVSRQKRLDRSLLCTGFAYDVATSRRNNLGLFSRMVKAAQAVRRPGSAALDLCWLAAGRLDGFWELKLHPWDTAAAKLVIEEAGGTLSCLDGSAWTIYKKEVLASNSRIHRQMSRLLAPGRTNRSA